MTKKLNIKNMLVISDRDWDELVKTTYNKPYCFQQQNGCQERGNHYITIPDHAYDFERDSIPEKVNGNEMGVSFSAWLDRDPKQKLKSDDPWDRAHGIDMFWERNFYPDIQMIANDLHLKGLIEAGKYIIEIDW